MYAPINQQNNAGFIALTTAILISVSLLTMVAAVSFQGFSSRFIILESELKEESAYLAESCVEVAKLKIAQNDHYHRTVTFPVRVAVGDSDCQIIDITLGTFPGEFIIKARAKSGEAVTNLQVDIDAAALPDVRVISWEEVPSF